MPEKAAGPDAGDAAPLVIVTRPSGSAHAMVADLQAQGVRAQSLPLIHIAQAADPAPVVQAWHSLHAHAAVMFVSAHAVQAFFALQPPGAAWPPGLLAASTGPGTTAALAAAGLPEAQIVQPDPQAGRFDSEALWAELQLRHATWQGKSVLVVRGEQGRDWLADTLAAQGAQVQFVAAYARSLPLLDMQAQALLAAAVAHPGRHRWHFSSSEAISNLQALAPQADWSRSRAWATHARIAEAARRAGFVDVSLVAPGSAAVVQQLRPAGSAPSQARPLQSGAL